MTNNTWIPNEAVGVGLTASEQDNDGGNWLFYEGGWGDEQYPNNDPRQLCIFSKCRYGSGPNGKQQGCGIILYITATYNLSQQGLITRIWDGRQCVRMRPNALFRLPSTTNRQGVPVGGARTMSKCSMDNSSICINAYHSTLASPMYPVWHNYFLNTPSLSKDCLPSNDSQAPDSCG